MLIRCKVRTECGGNCWAVSFPGYPGRSLYLQSDWDQAAFAVNCGAVTPPPAWRQPLPCLPGFAELDPTTIESCPDDYLTVAQADPIGGAA